MSSTRASERHFRFEKLGGRRKKEGGKREEGGGGEGTRGRGKIAKRAMLNLGTTRLSSNLNSSCPRKILHRGQIYPFPRIFQRTRPPQHFHPFFPPSRPQSSLYSCHVGISRRGCNFNAAPNGLDGLKKGEGRKKKKEEKEKKNRRKILEFNQPSSTSPSLDRTSPPDFIFLRLISLTFRYGER